MEAVWLRDGMSCKKLDINTNILSWEGLSIYKEKANKRFHIGNVYISPESNNNNQSKELFIEKFSQITDKTCKNMFYDIMVGEFSINLLYAQESKKKGEISKWMTLTS